MNDMPLDLSQTRASRRCRRRQPYSSTLSHMRPLAGPQPRGPSRPRPRPRPKLEHSPLHPHCKSIA
eukprot:scaffold109244_cov48-Phaeocystis_antarctica.AAC.2